MVNCVVFSVTRYIMYAITMPGFPQHIPFFVGKCDKSFSTTDNFYFDTFDAFNAFRSKEGNMRT